MNFDGQKSLLVLMDFTLPSTLYARRVTRSDFFLENGCWKFNNKKKKEKK